MEKELSIFVDESGDFGNYSDTCPRYIVSLILHNQKYPISEQVKELDLLLQQNNFSERTIHTGPLIRREQSYKNTDLNERRKQFYILYNFARKINITYKCININKKIYNTELKINGIISKDLSSFIKDNYSYFSNFEKIIVYYDNGQNQLTNILLSVFTAIFGDKIEFRNITPCYKLFQVADLICTLSLLKYKIENNIPFSKSETLFFQSPKWLKKNYLKNISQKSFENVQKQVALQ